MQAQVFAEPKMHQAVPASVAALPPSGWEIRVAGDWGRRKHV